jgi:hypothetical protein
LIWDEDIVACDVIDRSLNHAAMTRQVPSG